MIHIRVEGFILRKKESDVVHPKQLPRQSIDAFNITFSPEFLCIKSLRPLSWCWWVITSVDQPRGLSSEIMGETTYRPVNVVRGMDSTGMQLLRLEARRICSIGPLSSAKILCPCNNGCYIAEQHWFHCWCLKWLLKMSIPLFCSIFCYFRLDTIFYILFSPL